MMQRLRPTLSVPTEQAALQAVADLHAAMSLRDLRRANLPSLYQSGVRYRRESVGSEIWQLPTETARIGYGDCEDLAAWRCAELRLQGIPARMQVRQVRAGLWHVTVKLPNGKTEDPSRRLGMKGPG